MAGGFWARLHDAEAAYTNLKLLITKMTLPNMFDLCPPFQIDGNLGGPAVTMEMLVQSTPDQITLFPALPSQWDEGSLKGDACPWWREGRHCLGWGNVKSSVCNQVTMEIIG